MAVSQSRTQPECETAGLGVYRVLQGIHTVWICEAWNTALARGRRWGRVSITVALEVLLFAMYFALGCGDLS